jgi:hypothetical protein
MVRVIRNGERRVAGDLESQMATKGTYPCRFDSMVKTIENRSSRERRTSFTVTLFLERKPNRK